MSRYWLWWALRGLGLIALGGAAGAAAWETARIRREARRELA